MGPFATATEFCEWTGIGIPSDFARLQQLLDSASALIRGYTGQVLSQVAGDSVVVPATFADVLFLPQVPVTAISSITVDAVAFTDFTFDETGEVFRGTGFWTEPATVVYDHGYAEISSEFKAIRSVAIEMVKRAYTGDESGTALALGGIPVETVGFPSALFLSASEALSLPTGTAPVG